MTQEYYYRYEDDHSGSLYPDRYEVIKHTPKGVWIKHWATERGKFILNDSHKQWACPTIEAAQQSYIKRKARQIKILTAQLERVQNCYAIAMRGGFADAPLFYSA